LSWTQQYDFFDNSYVEWQLIININDEYQFDFIKAIAESFHSIIEIGTITKIASNWNYEFLILYILKIINKSNDFINYGSAKIVEMPKCLIWKENKINPDN
jgi:hypothetical protein